MFVLGKRYPEIERGKQGYSRDISPLLDVAPTPPLCSGTALLAWARMGGLFVCSCKVCFPSGGWPIPP